MFVNNLLYTFKAADIIFINYYNRYIGQWRKNNEKRRKRLYIYVRIWKGEKNLPRLENGIYLYS